MQRRDTRSVRRLPDLNRNNGQIKIKIGTDRRSNHRGMECSGRDRAIRRFAATRMPGRGLFIRAMVRERINIKGWFGLALLIRARRLRDI
jgi:hypothetical protein